MTRSLLSARRHRATRFLAGALLLAALTVGCGGGSSGGGGAPANDAVNADVFTAFPTTTAGFAVGAQGLTIPSVTGLTETGFVTYFDGSLPRLTILDLSGDTVTLDRELVIDNGTTNRLPTGVEVFSSSLAVVAVSDGGTGLNPTLYFFNPTTVAGPADFVALDLSGLMVDSANGLMASDGTMVSGSYPVSFPSGVLVEGGKLFVTFSNFGSNFESLPGSVHIFDFTVNLGAGTVSATNERERLTTFYNPIAMTALDTPSGRAVVVTLEGGNDASFNELAAGLNIINPTSEVVAVSLELGATSPSSALVPSPQTPVGFVTSRQNGGSVSLFRIDLAAIGGALSNSSSMGLPSALLDTFSISVNSSTFNSPPAPVVAPSGDLVYLLLDSDKRLVTVNAVDGGVVRDTTLTGPGRLATDAMGSNGFVDNPLYFARRPGDSGARLYILTTNLSAGSRTDADVPTTLDTVDPAFR